MYVCVFPSLGMFLYTEREEGEFIGTYENKSIEGL